MTAKPTKLAEMTLTWRVLRPLMTDAALEVLCEELEALEGEIEDFARERFRMWREARPGLRRPVRLLVNAVELTYD